MTQQLWQAAKLASVGELAASIAHELNNPLATVILRIESVLGRLSAENPNRRALEVVEQECKRMGDLVASLLQFSRRGDGQSSSVDLCKELGNSIELVQHILRKRQITVFTQFDANTPTIFADRQKFRQVFLNLLTNACDAMPDGGELKVRTSAVAANNDVAAVAIEIEDTGEGISPEHLESIMEPFFTTKEEGKGTGLGLAICRRVVEEHGGTIDISSQPGNGTLVRIAVPVKNGTNAARLRNSSDDSEFSI